MAAQHKKTVIALRNIVYLGIAIFLAVRILSKQPGYRWVYTMLKSNMETIRQYPDLTFEQKMHIKLGVSYDYLLYLKQSTPENAVILYPDPKAFRCEDSPFTQEIDNKTYATRFLYPRKIIRAGDAEAGTYAADITHVAIVNGRAADGFSCPVDSSVRHGIFSITPSAK
jgi:hypothetical protein